MWFLKICLIHLFLFSQSLYAQNGKKDFQLHECIDYMSDQYIAKFQYAYFRNYFVESSPNFREMPKGFVIKFGEKYFKDHTLKVERKAQCLELFNSYNRTNQLQLGVVWKAYQKLNQITLNFGLQYGPYYHVGHPKSHKKFWTIKLERKSKDLSDYTNLYHPMAIEGYDIILKD